MVPAADGSDPVESNGDNSTAPTTARTCPATPVMQNGLNGVPNTMTVTRKARTRQQTITVESQISKEVQAAFDEVKQISDLDDPVEELRRRMQRLFSQKESEWACKINEVEQNMKEELALTKIKLSVVLKTVASTENFLQNYKSVESGTPRLVPQTPSNALTSTPVNGALNRTFSPDALSNVAKERDELREELKAVTTELRELENSYSDLFKRYEKMRENCVLLKNSEESLKKNSEDDLAKYERIVQMYSELRASAANELQKANHELERIEKQHEENTLNLRCRLKRNESEINALNMTIQGKDNQLDELNKLCDELMQKNGVIDEVEGEDISLDDFS
ncbi:transforming acidic coiled-coil-containing protein (TACC) domain-containing protein [Ditylenchus destructor]|nr:transforming acidic coiled-coil-containing protein (TACC) domain-containing protein [Ditylenchus destructor]